MQPAVLKIIEHTNDRVLHEVHRRRSTAHAVANACGRDHPSTRVSATEDAATVLIPCNRSETLPDWPLHATYTWDLTDCAHSFCRSHLRESIAKPDLCCCAEDASLSGIGPSVHCRAADSHWGLRPHQDSGDRGAPPGALCLKLWAHRSSTLRYSEHEAS